MEPDETARVLRDYRDVHEPDADPRLEAVSTAILLEDVFGIVLSDDEIDPTVLTDPSAVSALVSGRRSA
jgi:hypothetical protein